MNLPDRPGRRRASGSFRRSVAGAAVRGTGLIALAVAVGIVLLQYSDDPDRLSSGREPAVLPPAAPTTSTTSAPAPGPRPPAEVTVLVLNGAGRAGVAGAMSERLEVVGYRTLEPGNTTRHPRSTVSCRGGFEGEATALVAATGLPAEVVEATDRLPGGSAADCVVVIGSS